MQHGERDVQTIPERRGRAIGAGVARSERRPVPPTTRRRVGAVDTSRVQLAAGREGAAHNALRSSLNCSKGAAAFAQAGSSGTESGRRCFRVRLGRAAIGDRGKPSTEAATSVVVTAAIRGAGGAKPAFGSSFSRPVAGCGRSNRVRPDHRASGRRRVGHLVYERALNHSSSGQRGTSA